MRNFKKLIFVISAICIASTSFAYATTTIPWISTSTVPNGFITPTSVNGIQQALYINSLATSTFNKLNVGYLEAPIFSSGICIGNAFVVDSPTFSVDCTNHRAGIGTTTPPTKFTVQDGTSYMAYSGATTNGYSQLSISGAALSISPILAFSRSAAQDALFGIASSFDTLIQGATAGDFVIRMADSTRSFDLGFNNSTTYFTVKGGGNTGIGTTSPSRTLSVQGSGILSGDLSVANLTATGTSLFAGNVGIGSSTPYAKLSVQSGASTGDAFVVATSSAAAVFGIDNDGHTFTSGPAPTISTCGTGTGTVVGDDQSGTITTATAATACTMTFSKAYRSTPTCTVTDNSLIGFADVASISTSAVTFGISSALTGGNLFYNCSYHK